MTKILIVDDEPSITNTNLVGNALQYTPPGGQVRVSAERTAEGVTVHVTDTGIGIPAGLIWVESGGEGQGNCFSFTLKEAKR